MLRNAPEGGRIDLDQHRNDHEPDQKRDWQIDLGDFGRAYGLKDAGEEMPERDAEHDTHRDPEREIAFES